MHHPSSKGKSNRALLCGLFFGFCDERARIFPHGNASKRTRPYIHTLGETMEKLRDNFPSGKSVTEFYDLTLKELGGDL